MCTTYWLHFLEQCSCGWFLRTKFNWVYDRSKMNAADWEIAVNSAGFGNCTEIEYWQTNSPSVCVRKREDVMETQRNFHCIRDEWQTKLWSKGYSIAWRLHIVLELKKSWKNPSRKAAYNVLVHAGDILDKLNFCLFLPIYILECDVLYKRRRDNRELSDFIAYTLWYSRYHVR